MLCCCNEDDLNDVHESYAPPNIQKRTKTEQNPRMIQKSQHINRTEIQPAQLRKNYMSNDRANVSPFQFRQSLFQSQKNSQIYPSRIDTLRNQLRNNKISLSRKRNEFTSRFKLLESRISELKSTYVQKEYKMNDLTDRINHLYQDKKQRNIFQHPNNFVRVQR